VEIDRRGKKLRYFGVFDSLYQQQFYFHGTHYSFVMSQNGKLLLQQELSDAIQVYAPPYEQPEALNFRGRFLSIDQQQLPITQSPYVNVEDYYSHYIAAYQYQFIELLNNSGLCYRIYADAATDSTLNKVYPESEAQSDPNMCVAPSQRKLEQLVLMSQKPWYIQLIEAEGGALLYDGAFPFEGKFLLPSKDDDPQLFYTYEWTAGWFKLYRYELKRMMDVLNLDEP
jgi:hypothetical protein